MSHRILDEPEAIDSINNVYYCLLIDPDFNRENKTCSIHSELPTINHNFL